jgi:hypothetical protein
MGPTRAGDAWFDVDAEGLQRQAEQQPAQPIPRAVPLRFQLRRRCAFS